MDVPLVRTWHEIADYLGESANPMRVVHVLNRVGPRNWDFRIGFDRQGRTIVSIACDPKLGDYELLAIVDAFIPEFFHVGQFVLAGETQSLVATPGDLVRDPPPTNVLPLKLATQQLESGQILLIGYFGESIPPQIQDVSRVRQELLEHTWFGSAKFARTGRYRVCWSVLGQKNELLAQDRLMYYVRGEPVFRKSVTISGGEGQHIGELTLTRSPDLQESRSYHSRLGRYDIEEVVPEFWRALDGEWVLEIDEPMLHRTLSGGVGPPSLTRRIVGAIQQAVKDVSSGSDYQTYRSAVVRREERVAAEALVRRQERAARALRVMYQGRYLQNLPTCENEVLALLCKLEALEALPLNRFQLVEYSPKRGIDALVNFQIDAADALVYLGAMEVEYQFENFFDHGHPVAQVALIVCWDFRDSEPPPVVPLKRVHEWLYSYSSNGHQCWLLVLAKIPGIEVKQEAR